MKTIVDTPVWIEYFKNNPDVTPFVDQGLLAGTVFMVGPVLSELLQAVKSEKELEKLTDCIDAAPFMESRFEDWQLAGLLAYKLRKKGITIPLTDLFIAALSLNSGASLFTYDHHFDYIPEVVLRKERPEE